MLPCWTPGMEEAWRRRTKGTFKDWWFLYHLPCFSSRKYQYQVLKRLAQIVGWKAGSYKTETVQISETQHRKTICTFCLWPRRGEKRLRHCLGFLVLFFFWGMVIKPSNFGTEPGCFTGARSGGWIECKTWIRGSHEPNGPPKKTEEQIVSMK